MSRNKKATLLGAGSYDVGYAKPPSAGQFIKGRSGNPKGRPKGAKNKPDLKAAVLADVVRAEAARKLPVGERGEKMSMIETIVRSITVKAAKGNTAAQRHSVALVNYAEEEEAARAEAISSAKGNLLCEGIRLKTEATLAEWHLSENNLPFPDWLPRPG